MKACYGTFLTSLLVIYEHDRVADWGAGEFNVTWNRNIPVIVSYVSSAEESYITGESDHSMGMDVIGDVENVWKFRFLCSFSFSLIEEHVGSNIWNETTVSSVTLSLLNNFLNNESLEIYFSDNEYIILHIVNSSNYLIIELSTGIVRDVYLNIYGISCYHDPITDSTVKFGENILNRTNNIVNWINNSLDNFNDELLDIIGGLCIGFAVVALISNPIGWGVLTGAAIIGSIGIICNYYASDLNKGWTNKRGVKFIASTALSIIPGSGPIKAIKGSGIYVGAIISKNSIHMISKAEAKGIKSFLMKYAEYKGGVVDQGTRKIIRFGTFERTFLTAYGKDKNDIIGTFIKDIIYGKIIDSSSNLIPE